MKKGSYFYLIDAFIAGSIIVLTLIAVTKFLGGETGATQNVFLAEDYFAYMQGTELRDLHSDTVTNMIKDGVINRTDQDLLTTTIELYHRNQTGCGLCGEYLKNLTKETIDEFFSEDKGARYSINQTTIYERKTETERIARTKIVSRRMGFYTINPDEFYGPVTAKIEVWL